MQGFKGALIVAAIVATAALGACRKEVPHEPMKLGAADVSVEHVAQ